MWDENLDVILPIVSQKEATLYWLTKYFPKTPTSILILTIFGFVFDYGLDVFSYFNSTYIAFVLQVVYFALIF